MSDLVDVVITRTHRPTTTKIHIAFYGAMNRRGLNPIIWYTIYVGWMAGSVNSQRLSSNRLQQFASSPGNRTSC